MFLYSCGLYADLVEILSSDSLKYYIPTFLITQKKFGYGFKNICEAEDYAYEVHKFLVDNNQYMRNLGTFITASVYSKANLTGATLDDCLEFARRSVDVKKAGFDISRWQDFVDAAVNSGVPLVYAMDLGDYVGTCALISEEYRGDCVMNYII